MAMVSRRVKAQMQNILLAIALVFLVSLQLFGAGQTEPLSASVLGGEERSLPYTVIEVVDGDTLALNIAGERETVRLLGIDTPETVHPNKPVECFGKEASTHLQNLVQGHQVVLELDSSQGDRDRYGRLLAYLYADEVFLNERMIQDGYAYEYTYSSPYRYREVFVAAEQRAREEGRGLWAEDTCAGER